MAHGYVECSCWDCFDVAVCSAPIGEECRPENHLCGQCEEAGCSSSGGAPCLVEPDEEEIDQ